MLTNSSMNNKIIKNTIILYIKLIVTTVVGLYSSRFILKALGIDDYGLYVVIGGVVTIMNFLSTVMTTTSYRFITVELGKGDKGEPQLIYNTIRLIHIFLAIFLLLLGETIGVHYVNHYLNVEVDKIPDALYLLHWSVITSAVSLLAIPSTGLIIAREKFLFTSIMEIARTFLKLFLVIILTFYMGNRLRLFAVIAFIYTSIAPISTILYCKMKEPFLTKWKLNLNFKIYKHIFSFASWTMLGAGSTIAQGQGVSIVLNVFFTPIVNAAYGLAVQVNGYVMMFVRNLGQAAVPQIIKSYSIGNSSQSLSLVYQLSKYSFFIILFPAVPCILCMDTVLDLWLGNVPQYTSIFSILLIISNLFWCISTGFDSTIQASGSIKNYQLWFSLINFSCLPICYWLFSMNFPPYTVTIYIILSIFFLLLLQIYILKRLCCFNMEEYWYVTLKPAIKVLFSLVPLFLLGIYLDKSVDTMLLLFFLSIIYIGISEYYIGFTHIERKIFIAKIKRMKK